MTQTNATGGVRAIRRVPRHVTENELRDALNLVTRLSRPQLVRLVHACLDNLGVGNPRRRIGYSTGRGRRGSGHFRRGGGMRLSHEPAEEDVEEIVPGRGSYFRGRRGGFGRGSRGGYRGRL